LSLQLDGLIGFCSFQDADGRHLLLQSFSSQRRQKPVNNCINKLAQSQNNAIKIKKRSEIIYDIKEPQDKTDRLFSYKSQITFAEYFEGN
jgi:hypothetical protein